MPRHGDPVSERTDVVAAERRDDVLVILHREPRQALEIRVRPPLLLYTGTGQPVAAANVVS